MAGSIVQLQSYVAPSDCTCNCTRFTSLLLFFTLSPMRFAALAYQFSARCCLLVTETGTPWFAVASAAIHVYNWFLDSEVFTNKFAAHLSGPMEKVTRRTMKRWSGQLICLTVLCDA